MNSNLFHNILNVAIAVLGAVTAFLLATGCTQTAVGVLECSKSWIDPTYTTVAISVLGVVKVLVNVLRDGIGGLALPQPPVQPKQKADK